MPQGVLRLNALKGAVMLNTRKNEDNYSKRDKRTYRKSSSIISMAWAAAIICFCVGLIALKTRGQPAGAVVADSEDYAAYFEAQTDENDKEENMSLLEEGTLSVYEQNDGIDPLKPKIALTFDDGPWFNGTERVLAILKKYNVRATFFVIGQNVALYPDLVKQEVEMGCEIGNHTYSHVSLTGLSESEINEQILMCNELVKEATGIVPTLVRPAGGNISDTASQILQIPVVLWSIDTRDWENRNSEKIAQEVLDKAQDGAIVLMHDIYDESADALEIIIPALLERGYQFVTVSELANCQEVTLIGGQIYKNFYK